MAYWDTIDQYASLFSEFAVGSQKVTVGVKPGKDGQDHSTPLDRLYDLTTWRPMGGKKAGMMLFGLNRDNPYFTGQPDWTYAGIIKKYLGP